MADDKVPPKDDPYEEEPPNTYECVECEHRIEAESRPGECPECGGATRNISKPSEK